MKKLFNCFMSLDSTAVSGNDYGMISFLLFIFENDILSQTTRYSLIDLSTYIYRFYLDNPTLKSTNNNRIIKNIQRYKPMDVVPYTNAILDILSSRIPYLIHTKEEIWFDYPLKNYTNLNKQIFEKILEMMIKKYINISNFNYASKLSSEDFKNYRNKSLGDKLFNRVLENINYCFICEQNDVDHLHLVCLNPTQNIEDINNYILLCETHAQEYENRTFLIDKNGYTNTTSGRTKCHIEINCLKKIRDNLYTLKK